MRRFGVTGSMLAVIVGSFTAGTATAQSLSVYERVRLNIASTGNGGNPQFIGTYPATIA